MMWQLTGAWISTDILADIPDFTGKSPLDPSKCKVIELSVFGLESLVEFPVL